MIKPVRDPQGRRRRRDAGVTLTEVLVVLVILGMIATIATPATLRYLSKAKIDSARLQLQSLTASLDMYHLDVGTYPSQAQGLAALVSPPPEARNWNGPYIKTAKSLVDPWGNGYVYKLPGEHGDFDLYSLGPDNGASLENDAKAIRSW